jgi:hypothetical protein
MGKAVANDGTVDASRYGRLQPSGRVVHDQCLFLWWGRHGMLTPDEERFRRENNEWYDVAYPDPSRIGTSAYDPEANPHAASWFKPAASGLINRVHGYLAILDAHNIAWEKVETTDPGRIV